MHTVEEIIEQVRHLSSQDQRRPSLLPQAHMRSPSHWLAQRTQISLTYQPTSISTWLRHMSTGITTSEACLCG
jgi:hypothetical protein